MNKLSFATIALTVTLAFAPHTQASTEHLEDFQTFTRDTMSGLDWLDVTSSQGQSFNQVSAQFGAGARFEGYRYATRHEFNELIFSVTGSPSDFGSTGFVFTNNGSLRDLHVLLGVTVLRETGFDTLGLVGEVRIPGWARHFEVDVAMIATAKYSDSGFTRGRVIDLETDQRNLDVGSFLVRDYRSISAVPEPATAFMFAPALLLCLGLRRRAKQA